MPSYQKLTNKEIQDILDDYVDLTKKEWKETHHFLNYSDLRILASKCYNLLPSVLTTQRQQRAAALAKTGERYCGHCIELWLWEKGYALNGLGSHTFTIEPQYYQHNHYIDFKVDIKTPSNTITLIIDSKNWARYSSKNVQTYIPTHLIPYNSFTATHKLIFINRRLIPKVKGILKKNNVEPIGINEHLTEKKYIRDFMVINNSMEASIADFEKLITIPDNSKNLTNQDVDEYIKYDIILGKPYKFIKLKYGIKKSDIDYLRAEIKKSGIKLPSRTTSAFWRLKQYNYYYKR